MKLIGLYVVWRLLSVLFGNPWLALAVLALALYALDRRFVVVRILVPVGPTVPANGQTAQARRALAECVETYRALPRFRRRDERRWALLAALRRLMPGGL